MHFFTLLSKYIKTLISRSFRKFNLSPPVAEIWSKSPAEFHSMGEGSKKGTQQIEMHTKSILSLCSPPQVCLFSSLIACKKCLKVIHIQILYCSPSCAASESSAADLYPYSRVKKKEPDIKVKKYKRRKSSNELNMCLNFALGMHSFSLGFPCRKTHLVSSHWHREWFTDGSASVIPVVYMIICHTDVSACICSLAASHAALPAFLFLLEEWGTLPTNGQLINNNNNYNNSNNK